MGYKERFNKITTFNGSIMPGNNKDLHAMQSKTKQDKARRANDIFRVMSGIKTPNKE